MYLNNYQYLKNKETFILILLITFSAFIRIPVILMFGDTGLENEWKVLVNNLVMHGNLSFRSFDGFLLPNLFMPPLYPYYLYFFSIFNFEEPNYIYLVLSSQILLSSISVAVFYKINKIFFSQKLSFYSSLFFSIFPLHLFACGQISSISLQIFLTILYFYFFFQFINKKTFLSIAFFSLTGGLLMLLRGEFVMIIILSILYSIIFFKISFKNILAIILITLITISPYLIRNVFIFNKITITKSFGYNLWKGNNSHSTVEGSELIDDNLQNQINEIPKDKYYEINLDKIFFNQARKNIIEEPRKYLTLFGKKILSFLLVDNKSTYPNYYNPLHYLPVLLLGIVSLLGIIFSNKKNYKLNYFILIFFLNVIIFSIFFILPRYKLIILPLQIIFANTFLEYIKERFFNYND